MHGSLVAGSPPTVCIFIFILEFTSSTRNTLLVEKNLFYMFNIESPYNVYEL